MLEYVLKKTTEGLFHFLVNDFFSRQYSILMETGVWQKLVSVFNIHSNIFFLFNIVAEIVLSVRYTRRNLSVLSILADQNPGKNYCLCV